MINWIPINIAVNATALLFFIFLFIIYATKKNANNIENKIYKSMLLWNFLSLVLHLLFQITGIDLKSNQVICNYFSRIYFCTILYFLTYFVSYIVMVTNEKNTNLLSKIEKKYTLVRIIYYILFLITFILIFFTPFNVINGYGGLLMGGVVSNIIYYFCLITYTIISIISIVKNKGKFDNKKVFAFYAIGCLAIIYIIVGFFYPGLCLFVVLQTICTYIMYHTIENPDMKLVNELTLAKNQAEKASNAKSDFLSSMSHELRTPLNAIVGLSTMIKDEQSHDEIVRDADDILKASNNLLELVDGILDINQLDSNNMEIINNNYNPMTIFNDLERMIKVRIGDKPIELRCRFSNDLPKNLNGDKDKVKRIINNLLTNAVKYTNEGYIDFNVDCVIVKDKCNLRISVSDTGRGIRDDQKDFLFTKFYRLESDKDSDIEGTGLGLAITKSLVELIGGEISVNSTEGFGTTFFVTITQQLVEDDISNNDTEIL